MLCCFFPKVFGDKKNLLFLPPSTISALKGVIWPHYSKRLLCRWLQWDANYIVWVVKIFLFEEVDFGSTVCSWTDVPRLILEPR